MEKAWFEVPYVDFWFGKKMEEGKRDQFFRIKGNLNVN